MIDQEQFRKICEHYQAVNVEKSGIGTLSEKTLHAVLKEYYEPLRQNQERKLGGYVADISGENGIIEIQTQGFEKLRKKLAVFLEVSPVTVVYPVAKTKYLCWIDPLTGSVTEKRKSPKRGTPFDAFFEFYKIKSFLEHPKLQLRVVLLTMEEYRFLNGWDSNRKRGSSRYERIPVDIENDILLGNSYDYCLLLPVELPELFTTKDLVETARIPLKSAQITLNIMHSVHAVEREGKRGNLFLYRKRF